MNLIPPSLRVFALLGVLLAISSQALGVVYIVVREVGDDVVMQHAGTLDLSDLTFDQRSTNTALLHPQFGSFFSGRGVADRYFGETSIGFKAFGPARGVEPESFEVSDSGKGKSFGVGSGFVFVPKGYISGQHISGSATFFGESLSSLELTPGVYTAVVPNDLLVLIVGSSLISGKAASEAVPEPWPYGGDEDGEEGDGEGENNGGGGDPDPGSGTTPVAKGTVPNANHPSSELNKRISPILGVRHNQPNIINGYLFLAGNAAHSIWDISDPYNPVMLSEMESIYKNGEAESHQVSFARYPDESGDRFYAATTSGVGIDLWDITDVTDPILVGMIALKGVNYGDSTEAVWGIHWQGDYIYVGGTNSGLHIVDASNPSNPFLVNRLPNPEFGGLSAGPLFAVGNVLVITSPKNASSIVTMDISDPANPALLDFVDPPDASYIGGYHGGKAFLLSPFRTYDVMSDPQKITLLGSDTTPKSEYMSFDNDLLFLGSVSRNAGGFGGVFKYDVSDPSNLVRLGHVQGDGNNNADDQFSVPVGNLIVVSDDGNRRGSWIGVHDTQRDTSPPRVLDVNPKDGSSEVPITSRIGLSFSDQIEFSSVDGASLVVRPEGGDPISGKWGYQQTLITFWPDQLLEEGTSYEVILPADGIADLVGNSLDEEFVSTFQTVGGDRPAGAKSEIAKSEPVELGQPVSLEASDADESLYQYTWDFGDGEKGEGAFVEHEYQSPGRYPVTLTVSQAGSVQSQLKLECEDGAFSGGVRAASMHKGYTGSGYIDYPNAYGRSIKVLWEQDLGSGGRSDVAIRYSNGGNASRPLSLFVNGSYAGALAANPTQGWANWSESVVENVLFVKGRNVIELVSNNVSGPNVDYIEIMSGSTGSVSTKSSITQIVHRPLTALGPTHSSSIFIDESRAKVWTVNPDTDTVSVVDTQSFAKVFEVPVGKKPRTLAQAPNGDVWVVNQESANITILNTNNGSQRASLALPPGSRPFGIAFSPDGNAAYVTLDGTGRLVKINSGSREIVASLELGSGADGIVPKVRGIALDGDSSRVLVTRFISSQDSGELFVVDAASMTLKQKIELENSTRPDTPDSSRGIPNYLNSVLISPDGTRAWLPSKQDNMDRGLYRDGLALTHDSTVRPIVSQVDLENSRELATARWDLNDADSPFTAVASDLGDLVFVALQGSNAIDVRNAYNGDSVAGFSVGLAPQGLALDGRGRLFVQNFMSRSLSVFDVSTILDGSDHTVEMLASVDLVARESLSTQVLLGKQIFYNANDERMSFEGYISCASCHLDGGEDGRVWDFTDRGEGFRNTISLRGRAGTGHGKVHWTGNFDEIQDFENDMRNAFSGTGFLSNAVFENVSEPLGNPKAGMSAELDALAAYVASLKEVPDSPYRESDGSLTEAGERGKSIFQNAGCVTCHSGSDFTDLKRHDVGTIQGNSGKGSGEALKDVGFDTPTLKGVWNTAPYLHNGEAPTLYDVIRNRSHGNASELSQAELEDLVAYLLQIDERE